MRSDIQKIVFERAKGGRTWASKTPRASRVALDSDGEQFDEASNRIRLKQQKMRNSHFSAVGRFLVRNIGRPWDKVYAEVCASADARNYLGADIRDYVESVVATKCWFEGRDIKGCDWNCVPGNVQGLYVHPKTKTLMRTPGHERIR